MLFKHYCRIYLPQTPMEYKIPKIYQTNSFCYDNPLAIRAQIRYFNKKQRRISYIDSMCQHPDCKKKNQQNTKFLFTHLTL